MLRHPRRRFTAAIAVLSTAAVLLGGCAGGDAVSSSSDTPVQGGVLKYRTTGANLSSTDPAVHTGYGPAVPVRGIVDSLVFQQEDGTIEPWLATEWTVDASATHYEYTLRDDVTFSNGEKLDSAAVKQSYDALVSQGAKYAVANEWIGDLREITTPDPSTVVFDFDSPNSSFLQASSTTSLGIVAPETAALSYEQRQEGDTIIGSGPFVVAETRGEEGYVLDRRDDYAWAPASAENQGAAYLDGIEVSTTPDNSIAAAQLRNGDIDLMHNTEPADKTEFSTNPDLTIRRDPLPGAALGFVVNTAKPGLDDPEVRRALALSVDREAVLERASAIDVPATSVFAASNPFWTDQSELITTDVDEAERLLDDAGWVKGDDGVREKDGERLSFDLIYSPSTISHEPNIAVVQSQWKDLGVELSFGSLTAAELNQRLVNGDYSFSWGSGTRPDVDVLRGNYGGLDPALDRTFAAILAEPDQAARQVLADTAARTILEQAYFIPLYDFIQPLAYRNTTHLPTLEASHLPLLSDVWVDES
ncbi:MULTISPECIES: ABC transporter substrate-binding protein [unclassified Nocardioides]|uniref:ABC transporter substrate-binding protein n=1 Tax=unclassified Nocardioides TaxID=2615069 RepID=UPI0030146063